MDAEGNRGEKSEQQLLRPENGTEIDSDTFCVKDSFGERQTCSQGIRETRRQSNRSVVRGTQRKRKGDSEGHTQA